VDKKEKEEDEMMDNSALSTTRGSEWLIALCERICSGSALSGLLTVAIEIAFGSFLFNPYTIMNSLASLPAHLTTSLS